MGEIETYSEPILGWRTWSLSTTVPISLTGMVYTSCRWNNCEPTHAICMKSRRVTPLAYMPDRSVPIVEPCKHPPDMSCNDGFFGFYDLIKLRTVGMFSFAPTLKAVRGCFQAWGGIILHEDGFRAEWAEPVALIEETPESIKDWNSAYSQLLLSEKYGSDEQVFEARRGRVDALAKRYKIPIVPLEDIEEYSKQYGSPPA